MSEEIRVTITHAPRLRQEWWSVDRMPNGDVSFKGPSVDAVISREEWRILIADPTLAESRTEPLTPEQEHA